MGDRMAVIGEGRLKQVGTPEEVFRHPNSEFVARFVMVKNILWGTASRKVGGKTVFRVQGFELITDATLEGTCYASIRPEDILISREKPRDNIHNCFPTTITRIVNKGSLLYVTAELPPALTCLVTRHSFEEMQLTTGKRVYLTFPPSSVHLFLD